MTQMAGNANSLKGPSLRRQWLFAYLGTTLFVVGLTTLTAWWVAYLQTKSAVEERLQSIGRVVAAPAYPMHPSVLRSISDLSNAGIALLDRDGQWVDGTESIPKGAPFATRETFQKLETEGIVIDHDFVTPDKKHFHAGWSKFEPSNVAMRAQGISYVGVLLPYETVKQMRWQAILLPWITGMATAVPLGAIAVWLTSRVVRRVQVVQEKVRRIASGDYEPIELHGPKDELHDLSLSVNSMALDLQTLEGRIHQIERERLIHTMAAGLSHDLRNTLTGARLAIQLHGRTCHVDAESLEVAMRQLRLAEDQLHRWLRIMGESEVAETHELSKVIEEVIQLTRPTMDHFGTEFHRAFQIDDHHLLIPNAPLVSSVLLNLLLNAIQAAGSQGSVWLTVLRRDDRNLHFEIEDSGAGPSPEIAERMFEPLVTTKPEGVGLGLALVAKAAKRLHGSIEWTRRRDRTLFHFSLPIDPTSSKDPVDH